MKIIISALLAGLVMMSSSAIASDGKNYTAATSCVSSGGSPSVISGRLYNISTTSAMTVNCGVINDGIGDVPDFSQTQVWVHDQTSAGSIACKQFSLQQSSSSITTSSATLAYPSAAGAAGAFSSSTPTLLSLSSGGTGRAFSASSPVWNYLLCTIPASTSSTSNLTGILSYYTVEI